MLLEHLEKEAEPKTTILKTGLTNGMTDGTLTIERVKDVGAVTEEGELADDKETEADEVADAIMEGEKVGDMATKTTDDAMIEEDDPFKGKPLIALLAEISLEVARMADETIVAIETARPDVVAGEQEAGEILAVAIRCPEIVEGGMNTKTRSSCFRMVGAAVVEAVVDVEGEEDRHRTSPKRELDTMVIIMMRDTMMMAMDTTMAMDTVVELIRSPRNEEEVEVADLLAEEEVVGEESGLTMEKLSQRTETMKKEGFMVTMPTQKAESKVTPAITLLLWSRLPILVAAEVTDTRLEADSVGVEEAVAAPSPEGLML